MAETLTPYINFKVAEGTDYFTYPNHVRYNFELADIAIDSKLDKGTVSTGYNTAKKIEDKIIQSNPVGVVTAYAGVTAPAGWLLCDGSTFNATTYAVLNTLLGGNTLPDLRGEFIRGLDNSRGVDAGRTNLSSQTEEFKSHDHAETEHTHDVSFDGANGSNSTTRTNDPRWAWGDRNHGITNAATQKNSPSDTSLAGGTETRPRNVAMNYIVKAL